MSEPAPFTDRRCTCLPFQQSWRKETPGWCATCGLPFATYSKAREVSDEEYRLLVEEEAT